MTPEQIAADYTNPLATAVQDFLAALTEHGYRIVHPDDVPLVRLDGDESLSEHDQGWNACRQHIFGDQR